MVRYGHDFSSGGMNQMLWTNQPTTQASNKETRRQGDKETRRPRSAAIRGISCCSLTSCLPVSLSPCLLVSLSWHSHQRSAQTPRKIAIPRSEEHTSELQSP